MNRWSREFALDLFERTASTFLAALIPLLVAAGQFKGLDWQDALATAAFAALLSLLKGLAANLADPHSGASLLPAPPGPEIEPADDGGPARWNERGESLVGLAVVVVLIVVVLAILLPRI